LVNLLRQFIVKLDKRWILMMRPEQQQEIIDYTRPELNPQGICAKVGIEGRSG
jgi:hypothetical protein